MNDKLKNFIEIILKPYDNINKYECIYFYKKEEKLGYVYFKFGKNFNNIIKEIKKDRFSDCKIELAKIYKEETGREKTGADFTKDFFYYSSIIIGDNCYNISENVAKHYRDLFYGEIINAKINKF